MPPLPNVKQEKFVRLLFEGEPAVRAYELAGYKPHQGNSSRLRWYEMVQSRLAELQAEAAKDAQVSVQSLLNELEEARQRAMNVDQMAAATASILGKAKLSGLLINRSEIKVSDGFESINSVPEIAAKTLRDLTEDHPDVQFTDEDIAGAIRLFQRQSEEMLDYARSCVARLIPAINPPMGNRLTPAEIEHKKLIAERTRRSGGNGQRR